MMTNDELTEIEQRLDKLKQRQVKLNEEMKRVTQPAPFYWETKQGRKEMRIMQFQMFIAKLMAFVLLLGLYFFVYACVETYQAYQDAHPKQIIVTVYSDDGSDCKTLKGVEK